MRAINRFPLLQFQAPPKPKLLLTRTALVEEYPLSEYIYGRWDAIFGAWKRNVRTGVTVEFVPSYTFETTALFEQDIKADGWFGEPGQRVTLREVLEEHEWLFALDLLDLPDLEESPEEINAYHALIPQRFQHACASLGKFSWLGLEACWYFEDFSDWLLRSRWHGRFAALIWFLADAKNKPRRHRRELHQRIYNERSLALLSTFMSDPEAQRCLGILRRLNGRALDDHNLEGLRLLAQSPGRIRAVSHLGDLRAESLRTLAGLPAWLGRPAALAGALAGEHKALEFLELVRRHPNLLNAQTRTWIAKRMENVREKSDVNELRERWQRRVATTMPFPEPPIALPPPFEPIDTFAKLQHEGRQMNNCSVDYAPEILAGNSYFYHWAGTEPATVRLEFSSIGRWQPAEIKGSGNTDISQDAVAAVLRVIAHTQNHQSAGVIKGSVCAGQKTRQAP